MLLSVTSCNLLGSRRWRQAPRHRCDAIDATVRSHTDSAVLRTAEALGYHHVWVVAPPTLDIDAAIAKRQPRRAKNVWKQDEDDLREHVAYAKRASKWLQLRFFADSDACVEALRAEGREIWSTDLSQAAVCLTNAKLRLPARLAVVICVEIKQ